MPKTFDATLKDMGRDSPAGLLATFDQPPVLPGKPLNVDLRQSRRRPTWSSASVSFHPDGAGHILVDVHQVVRGLTGDVLGDEHVGHRFTIEAGLIQAMEVCPPP